MFIETLLLSVGVITTYIINYKFFNKCIQKNEYDEIIELNQIKKKMNNEDIIARKKLQKILEDEEFDEFIIINNGLELANKK